ncbi:MAG: hypothetical protein IPP62_16155 [bacterium]|nr:hypothetical protein [bacterium]
MGTDVQQVARLGIQAEEFQRPAVIQRRQHALEVERGHIGQRNAVAQRDLVAVTGFLDLEARVRRRAEVGHRQLEAGAGALPSVAGTWKESSGPSVTICW